MRHVKLRPALRGFSLVELAIALVILALLSAGAIAALRVQMLRAQNAEVRAQLQDAREALINYAAVLGSLPCPDTDGDGKVDTCVSSGVRRGRLPWNTLALPKNDAWGQSLYYAVSGAYTSSASVSLNTVGAIVLNATLSGGGSAELANPESLAFVIWSSGADATNTSATAGTSEVVAQAPDSDDLVVWVSRFIVLGRMLEAGRDVPTTP